MCCALDTDGTQILKELLQNADDADASEVVFLLDRRHHPKGSIMFYEPGAGGGEQLPPVEKGLEQWQGPALLVFDDKPFRAEDFESLQTPANSAKKTDYTKTGKVGR